MRTGQACTAHASTLPPALFFLLKRHLGHIRARFECYISRLR